MTREDGARHSAPLTALMVRIQIGVHAYCADRSQEGRLSQNRVQLPDLSGGPHLYL